MRFVLSVTMALALVVDCEQLDNSNSGNKDPHRMNPNLHLQSYGKSKPLSESTGPDRLHITDAKPM